MRINLAQIMSKPDNRKEFVFNTDLETICYMGEDYKIADCDEIKVTVVNAGNRSVNFTLSTNLSLKFSCSRCLTDVVKRFHINFDDNIKVDENGKGFTQDDEGTDYIDEFELDTDLLITQEMYLNMPSQVLCDDDCKGMCSVCGINLNQAECSCDRQVLDPRMAKIRDIFNNFKEV